MDDCCCERKYGITRHWSESHHCQLTPRIFVQESMSFLESQLSACWLGCPFGSADIPVTSTLVMTEELSRSTEGIQCKKGKQEIECSSCLRSNTVEASNGWDRNGTMTRLDSFIRHPYRRRGGHEALTEGGPVGRGTGHARRRLRFDLVAAACHSACNRLIVHPTFF
jgi:hypothetical protein